MELVYLWVEKYKNIYNQGFNFSSRFECNYNHDANELTIDKNDDYISNFFSDNINVTAIVGRNGSGKSSLIEFILDRLADRHDIYPKDFIFIYFYENKLYEYNNFQYKISSDLIIEKYPNKNNLISYYKDTIAININSEYKEIETRETQQIFSENNKYDKNSSNLVILENYINNKNLVDKIKEDFFIPDKIKIGIKSIGYYQSILKDNRDYYSDNDWEEILNLIDTLKDKTFYESLKIKKKIFKLKKEKHQNNNEKDFSIGLLNDRKSPNQYHFNDDLLEDKSIPKILEEYTLNQPIAIGDIDNNFLSYIKKLPYIFEIDLIDKNNININSLSFGEKQLLIQLHYILRHSSKKEYQLYHPPSSITDDNGDGTGEYYGDYDEDVNINNAFIFLDEFELGLHPLWQKKVIDYIVGFLTQVKNKKFNFVITTHSPFLLSDIPKQNIIFLDTDDEGKCKVVDGLKEKKETFGANIHTLLSDSFFMDDGLMGEFAKDKIEEVIEFLRQDKITEELDDCINENTNLTINKVESIISIIGEPLLQVRLKKMLIDYKKRYNLFTESDIEQQIKKLQIELQNMRQNG